METGDPGAPEGAPAEEGRPGSPPGWNPQPPGSPWPPPPPPTPGSPPGWNPQIPGRGGAPAWPPAWGPPPPAGGWAPPPGGASPPPPGGWPPPPAGGWPPPPGGAYPPPPPGAPAGWNPAIPGAQGGGWYASGSGLRPRGVGELLDGAFTLYRRNFLLLVAIAAVVQVPFALLSLIGFELANIGGRLTSLQTLSRELANQGNTLTPEQTSQLANSVGAAVAYFAALFIVQFFIVTRLSQAAITSAVSARYLDQPTSVGASYRAALSRWRALIAMVLWLMLIIVGPFALSVLLAFLVGPLVIIALIVMAIFVFIILLRTTVAPQAIVLERKRGWPGIRRSFELTNGSSWRIFGILLLLGIIQAIAGAALSLPLNALISAADFGTQQVVGQVAQAFVSVFITPIGLVTLTLLYYDLRIRREGFDIEMLAASL